MDERGYANPEELEELKQKEAEKTAAEFKPVETDIPVPEDKVEHKRTMLQEYRESDSEKYKNALKEHENEIMNSSDNGHYNEHSDNTIDEEATKRVVAETQEAEEAKKLATFRDNIEDLEAQEELFSFYDNFYEDDSDNAYYDTYFEYNNYATEENVIENLTNNEYYDAISENYTNAVLALEQKAEELKKAAEAVSNFRNDTFHINNDVPVPEKPNVEDVQGYARFKNRSKHSMAGINRQVKTMAIAATHINDTETGQGLNYIKQRSDIFKAGTMMALSFLPQTTPWNKTDKYIDGFFKNHEKVAANLKELTGGQMSEWNPRALEKLMTGKYRVRDNFLGSEKLGFIGRSPRLKKAAGKFLSAKDLYRLDGGELNYAIEHLGSDGKWHVGLNKNDQVLLDIKNRMNAKSKHSLRKIRIKNVKNLGREAKQLFFSEMRGSEMSKGMDQISQWRRGVKTVVNLNKHFYNTVINKPLEKLTGHSFRTVKNTAIKKIKQPFQKAGKAVNKRITQGTKKVGGKAVKAIAKRLPKRAVRGLKTTGRGLRVGVQAGHKVLQVIAAPFNAVKAVTQAAKEALRQGAIAVLQTLVQALSGLLSAIGGVIGVLAPFLITAGVFTLLLMGLIAAPDGTSTMELVCQALGAWNLDEDSAADDIITNNGREGQMIQMITNMRYKSPAEYLYDFDTRGGSDIETHDPDKTLNIAQGTWGAPNRKVTTNNGDDGSSGDETSTAASAPDGTYVNFFNGNYTKRDPDKDFLVNEYTNIVEEDVKNTAHTHEFYSLSYDHDKMVYYLRNDKDNAIPYYSNLREIISAMSVVLEENWSDEWDYSSVLTYAQELWESTHDAYVETSKVYQCDEADFSNQTSKQMYQSPSTMGSWQSGDDDAGTILTYGHGCKRAVFNTSNFKSSSKSDVENKLKKMLEYKEPAPEGGKSDTTYDGCVLFYNRFKNTISQSPDGKWHIGWYYHYAKVKVGSHQDSDGNTVDDYKEYKWYTFGKNDDEKVAIAYCPGHVNLMVNVMISGMVENNECLLVDDDELTEITEEMLEDTMFDQHDDPSTAVNDSYSPYPVLVASEWGKSVLTNKNDQVNHFSTSNGWKNLFDIDKEGYDDYEAVGRAVSKYQTETMDDFKEINGFDLRTYIYKGHFWMTDEEVKQAQKKAKETWEDMEKTQSPTVSGNYSSYSEALIAQATSAVGRIPYYWGGSYSHPDYDGNNFNQITTPDSKGRNKKGLDCSAYCSWVYYSVACHMSEFNQALIAQTGQNFRTRSSTAGLPYTGSFVVSSSTVWPQLSPGDIIFVKQTGDKCGHAMIFERYDGTTNADGTFTTNGKMWIYQEGGSEENVNYKCKNILSYYNGRTMYYLHIG